MNKTVLGLCATLVALSPASAGPVTFFLQMTASTSADAGASPRVSSSFDSGVLAQTTATMTPLFSTATDLAIVGLANENGSVSGGAIHGFVSAEGIFAGGAGHAAFTGIWSDTLAIGGLPINTPVTIRVTNSLHSVVGLSGAPSNSGIGFFVPAASAEAFVFVNSTTPLQALINTDATSQSSLVTSMDFVFRSGSNFTIQEDLLLGAASFGSSLHPDVLALADASNTSNVFIDVLTPGATLSSASGTQYSSATAPEPSSFVLMGCSLLAYSLYRLRSRSAHGGRGL
jgi:hypothetical protein